MGVRQLSPLALEVTEVRQDPSQSDRVVDLAMDDGRLDVTGTRPVELSTLVVRDPQVADEDPFALAVPELPVDREGFFRILDALSARGVLTEVSQRSRLEVAAADRAGDLQRLVDARDRVVSSTAPPVERAQTMENEAHELGFFGLAGQREGALEIDQGRVGSSRNVPDPSRCQRGGGELRGAEPRMRRIASASSSASAYGPRRSITSHTARKASTAVVPSSRSIARRHAATRLRCSSASTTLSGLRSSCMPRSTPVV